MLLEAKQIKKAIGEKQLFAISEWQINEGERIGIVGRNSSGKTTLLHCLAKKEEPDEGTVMVNSKIGMIEQMPDREEMTSFSGGEMTRKRIQSAFAIETGLIFADEPTSHLDADGKNFLEKNIQQFNGAIVMVSHDRAFLDRTCTKIVELEAGEVHFYPGNYTAYEEQKALEQQTAQAEYDKYEKEKKHIKQAMQDVQIKTDKIRRTPKRMGNSEARLHKMGGQQNKKKLDRTRKNLEKRLEHMETKQKPIEAAPIQIQLEKGRDLHNQILISGEGVSKRVGKKVLFRNSCVQLLNHSKTALVGANGSGKTTLLNMILAQGQQFSFAKNVHFGYFSQTLHLLDDSLTVLENVMKKSVHDETFVRMLLARLLFKGADVYKKVTVLSGGERNKVSMALLLVSDANVLIFDEPTNYLDLASIKAVEEAIKAYQGTVLFVTHDEQLMKNTATHIWQIENQSIRMGEVERGQIIFQSEPTKEEPLQDEQEKLMVMENRLSALIGKLSVPSKKDNKEALEKEYQDLLIKIRELKASM
ncbi:ribosomal protection-like ABC-F family protein [Pisciglobus halotolerans]|uniref:Macrolide transport system ATP-binding/permease protein n=1 Tax=Pisciglobus halotolerans TaxID=745365 RepID=A0A1I3CM31_9LACT|nr:ABC-F family ATP-binding cassette domain-containing protein [Pisciglobus halotolerans]SFH75547.1 macrolide transport system ATP-binding/permease protein [Pisciglobus halotolerans]